MTLYVDRNCKGRESSGPKKTQHRVTVSVVWVRTREWAA